MSTSLTPDPSGSVNRVWVSTPESNGDSVPGTLCSYLLVSLGIDSLPFTLPIDFTAGTLFHPVSLLLYSDPSRDTDLPPSTSSYSCFFIND